MSGGFTGDGFLSRQRRVRAEQQRYADRDCKVHALHTIVLGCEARVVSIPVGRRFDNYPSDTTLLGVSDKANQISVLTPELISLEA